MRNRRLVLFLFLVACGAAALGQSNPVYIQFSPSVVKGAYYKPDSGPAPHVAVLIMHRTSNVMGHIATKELPARGFAVLAMNSRFDNNEAIVDWEDIALDVKSGVEFLKKQPGITKIILFGHSGGGATMSFYEAVAEKGPAYCQGPGKLVQCAPDRLTGLPRADGIIFVDAHPGIAALAVRSLNAAVTSDADPRQIDASLDPFSTQNGYNPASSSHYSEAFQKKYFKAQADRMGRLIADARGRMKQIKEGKGAYSDDDVFLIVRGEGARLTALDTAIHHSTAKPQKLIKNDGTIVTQVVESVRRATPESKKTNGMFRGGTNLLTLRSFMSANAIHASDSMNGIDWCSTNNSTPCALQNISVPVLITAMGAHFFVRDNEIHYEMSASKDKDFVVIEGATHGISPCKECETAPGQYSNSVKNFFDYLAKWMKARW